MQYRCVHTLCTRCRCGDGGPSFGVQAAELWSRLMQHAEGENAFRAGYERLLKKYCDDPARTQYIHELFDDPDKAHFKQTQDFRNCVLVDVCEILFSATKSWVFGKSKKSPSLLMAVVRITKGVRELILRSFLKDQTQTRRVTVDKTKCRPVITLLTFCCKYLTSWAVRKIHTLIDQSWLSYTLQRQQNDEIVVARRHTGKLIPYASLMPPLCLPYASLIPPLCLPFASLLPPFCVPFTSLIPPLYLPYL